MHLLERNSFVMWDADIRDEYHFENNDQDYFNFLKLMQEKFGKIDWRNPNKTFTKAIDEYNTVNMTLQKR